MSYSDQQPSGMPTGAPVVGAPTYNLTPWIKRVGAYLVDAVIASAIYFVGVITGKIAIILLFGLISFAFSIWNFVFKQGTTGQTIGKGVLGIKLVREADAQVLGPANTFIRMLAHIVDSIPFDIGYLWPLWDPKRQTFADKICHTVVIDV